MPKIMKLLKPPFELPSKSNPKIKSRVAHVYFTHGGIIESRSVDGSICDASKVPLTAIQFDIDVESTAVTAAHAIGHLLGIGHDFDAYENRGKECHKQFLVQLKNKKIQPKEWSKCANQEFFNYYQKVLKEQDQFCLQEER